eukprot:1084253-Pleurochrysis_carterae.AAC.1
MHSPTPGFAGWGDFLRCQRKRHCGDCGKSRSRSSETAGDGRKSRRSTRRPHSAAFVLHRVGRVGPKRKKLCGLRVWESLTCFPCVTAGEAVAKRTCSTETEARCGSSSGGA